MARRTKTVAIIKNKEAKKPKLTMTPIEIRNARKAFLLREELKNEELKQKKWEEMKKMAELTEISPDEKQVIHNELFEEILSYDEKLFEINEELIKIERIEKDEKHQEALDNIIEIRDDDDEVEIFEIIDLED